MAEKKAVTASPAKKEAKPASAPKKAEKPTTKEKEATKVYHIAKRKEDNKWALYFAGGKKVIKLFDTKVEAEAAAKQMSLNQDATLLVRNSKGAKAGKFASSFNKNKK